jgi:hypothetical protein
VNQGDAKVTFTERDDFKGVSLRYAGYGAAPLRRRVGLRRAARSDGRCYAPFADWTTSIS